MVLTLAIPLRRAFGLHDFITDGAPRPRRQGAARHARCFVAYGYAIEIFIAFYSGDAFEIAVTIDRWTGAYAPVYWTMLLLQRRRAAAAVVAALRGATSLLLFVLGLVVNVGMWIERFMIVVSSLHRDFLPSAWGIFIPTLWDWVILLGSISAFAWLFLRLRSPAAGDLDLRDARARARERRAGGARMSASDAGALGR